MYYIVVTLNPWEDRPLHIAQYLKNHCPILTSRNITPLSSGRWTGQTRLRLERSPHAHFAFRLCVDLETSNDVLLHFTKRIQNAFYTSYHDACVHIRMGIQRLENVMPNTPKHMRGLFWCDFIEVLMLGQKLSYETKLAQSLHTFMWLGIPVWTHVPCMQVVWKDLRLFSSVQHEGQGGAKKSLKQK